MATVQKQYTPIEREAEVKRLGGIEVTERYTATVTRGTRKTKTGVEQDVIVELQDHGSDAPPDARYFCRVLVMKDGSESVVTTSHGRSADDALVTTRWHELG